MRLKIDVTMQYQVRADETVLLTIEAVQSAGQTILSSEVDVENAALKPINGTDIIGKRFWALVDGERLSLNYSAQAIVDRVAPRLGELAATELTDLPGDLWAFLHPSRYCPCDLFTNFVDRQFGHLQGGAKIAAMTEWLRAELSYVPGSSNASTTAADTFTSRMGVCRDYTHLLCAFARAAYIPARYASVYATNVNPQDFHAVAEVWLDGEWHLVDPTGMSAADQMVLIASGRDAGDVAFMETPGWASPIFQQVHVTRA